MVQLFSFYLKTVGWWGHGVRKRDFQETESLWIHFFTKGCKQYDRIIVLKKTLKRPLIQSPKTLLIYILNVLIRVRLIGTLRYKYLQKAIENVIFSASNEVGLWMTNVYLTYLSLWAQRALRGAVAAEDESEPSTPSVCRPWNMPRPYCDWFVGWLVG